MTYDNGIEDNKTRTFSKGDKVYMHNCMEANIPKNKDKTWVCKTDSYLDINGQDVVFLEGYSGYFSVKFLKLNK